jgi:hypothetical protein
MLKFKRSNMGTRSYWLAPSKCATTEEWYIYLADDGRFTVSPTNGPPKEHRDKYHETFETFAEAVEYAENVETALTTPKPLAFKDLQVGQHFRYNKPNGPLWLKLRGNKEDFSNGVNEYGGSGLFTDTDPVFPVTVKWEVQS